MQTPQTKEHEICNEDCKKSLYSFLDPDLSLSLFLRSNPQFGLGCGFVQVSGTKQVIEPKQNPLPKPQIFALKF